MNVGHNVEDKETWPAAGKCCHRPLNEQICLLRNSDFYKTVPEAADLIFAGAVDLLKFIKIY